MDTLRPSQEEGVAFLAPRRVAFLADDTGLGKSAQSIRAADRAGAQRILIICQAIGLVSWAIEIPKWQTIQRQVVMFDSSTTVIPPVPVAVVASFDSLSRVQAQRRLRELLFKSSVFGGFDVVIIDEAHHLANPKSNRTKAIYGAKTDLYKSVVELTGAPRVWLLSATFQRKNASELYPHLAAMAPNVLAQLFGFVPKLSDFVDRYCLIRHTPFGDEIVGNNPDTIGELREAMRPFMLRRVKKDVAAELGAVSHVTLPVPVSAPVAASALDDYLDALTDDAEFDPSPEVVSELRQLGLAKTPACIEWVKDFLDADPTRKLVVFARHRDVLQAVFDACQDYQPALIHGGVTPSRKALEVSRFQNDAACRLFIGQIIAAGTSITLTAASTVLMIEPGGIPADDHQAVSRVHRIGQTEPVTAYYAFAAGTADERHVARAKRRARDFEALIGAMASAA